jgi:hypothetical protein
LNTPGVPHKPQRTVRIDPEADEFLRTLIPQRTGCGAFLSRLVLEYKLRRELEATRPRPVSRQSWEASGVRIY